jgi:hypothetical protein
MTYKQALAVAVAGGLVLGALLAFLTELHQEREFIAYVYQPLPAPREVGELMDEARQITTEAAGDA